MAVTFALAQLALVRPGMGLGWDETVYVSQISGHAPAAFFSAPRARGVSLLVAPIAVWSSSTPLLRVYLAVLSGIGLWLALRAWRGLFPAKVLALGGALFASLWVTLFYGPQAMPNYWVAIGALAGVGCFLHAQADRTRRAPVWGLAAAAALMALMRPMDAAWVGLPLLMASAVVRRWRYNWLSLALAAGLAAGAAGWVIEAYTGYGGLGRRLHDASLIQGGLSWNVAVDDQMRSQSGRTLCRPCTGGMPNPVLFAWWLVFSMLAAVGLAVAVRARRAVGATALPLACAAAAAFPYLFLIGYAAPRFLLPAYALLAIPVAYGLVSLVRATPGGAWRATAVTLAAVTLAGHLVVQLSVLHQTVGRATESHRDWARTAAALNRAGVRPPCVLTGDGAIAPHIPIAFSAACSSADTDGHNGNTTAAALAREAGQIPVAVLTTRTTPPPTFARGWRLIHVHRQTYAYVGPAVQRFSRAGNA
ncbi:hypothetical protein [Streptomyces sp. CMB-StM0423]|uniref:hypothetical protein n=1 Tax=Streptomyces sp. CMB-StM0423 TaxID=2059884 RepID=UPI000C714746|nr:hypothetical protein [Streptomyces sp. CMB-StM0423]AUH44431.1 hypothetical protein CXR04_33305 [Streptomyces sp. CMB-StM0423]